FLLKERAQKWQQHTRSFNKKKAFKRPSQQGLEKAYNGTLVDYVLKRGLDPQVCLSHGIFMAKRKFSGIERDCLAFAFYEGSQIINIQYKTTDKQFSFEADCELIPYGIDNVLGCDEMIITEGLFDAEAMIEAGFANTVSVPNGTGTDFKRSFERFKYSHLADIKTVYIAGDNDEEGLKCRENIAAYFGEARCKQVE
uniref:toprim domain-containing protein n=1 Tax=Segatella paludivivens TaxID=185294 RepID=UPI0012DBEE3C